MSAGIDYGCGTANVDHATGFRYGVISQHSVLQAWADSAEPDYGKPACPKCGNEVVEYSDEAHGDYLHVGSGSYRSCADYACEACERYLVSEDAFGDEALGWSYNDEGYELTDCLDSDIFILKSPYYTKAQFCSPCVPGAGNLDSPDADGVETYCLGHDWFEDGKAPYPVYSVQTREQV